ncbi:histidine phosphatase family protein [Pseudomonadota bacterium]
MALYFVRHGQTDWNLQRRFQSRSDIPLNATGISQAKRIQKEFHKRNLNFQAVHSSPLGRAFETAKIIVAGSGLSIQLEPTFVELDLGAYEGRFEDDLAQEHGEQYGAWQSSEFTLSAPGGETIFEAVERIHDALFNLRQPAIDGDILVVAHQAVFMAMKLAIGDREDLESFEHVYELSKVLMAWYMLLNNIRKQLIWIL